MRQPGQDGLSCSHNGFGGDVELDIVSIAVEVKTVAADDGTDWEHVQNEK